MKWDTSTRGYLEKLLDGRMDRTFLIATSFGCTRQKSLPILEMYSGDALLAGGSLLLEREIEEVMLELLKPSMKGKKWRAFKGSKRKLEETLMPELLFWMKPMRRRLSLAEIDFLTESARDET